MREISPDDRFQLRNAGELMHPGVCLACGVGTRQEGYVDLQVFFDYEGQMYLCALCLEEAAEVIGCLRPSESVHLQQLSEKIANENAELKERLADAQRRLAPIDEFLSGLATRVSPSLGDEILAEARGASDESVGTDTADADGSVNVGEPVVKESAQGRRRLNAVARPTSSNDASDRGRDVAAELTF